MTPLVPPPAMPSLLDFERNPLTFLWIELTNRCNLQCVHCYSESAPSSGDMDILTPSDYVRVIEEGAALGCTQLQFIGGEPTLHPNLPDFIERAKQCGYSLIEVYTNLIYLPSALLDCFRRNDVQIATSVYSSNPDTHDRITTVPGSQARTLSNIALCVSAGLSVRAGIVLMELNQADAEVTQNLLMAMGVAYVRTDKVRNVGRGQSQSPIALESDLCGKCWQGSLCVAPNGTVSPCIMSKQWQVGSILADSLESIARAEAITTFRREQSAFLGISERACDPNCNPSCEPVCNPRCSPVCDPSRCAPSQQCNPDLYAG